MVTRSGKKIPDTLEGFQQDKENDSQWRALCDRMGEVEFFGCGRKKSRSILYLKVSF
jgi:hypothetical protein